MTKEGEKENKKEGEKEGPAKKSRKSSISEEQAYSYRSLKDKESRKIGLSPSTNPLPRKILC